MGISNQITTYAGPLNWLTCIKQADRLLNPLVMEPKHPIGSSEGSLGKKVLKSSGSPLLLPWRKGGHCGAFKHFAPSWGLKHGPLL